MISVITPVLNGEKYIKECLCNVIKQHCVDVEHIIIDGGSKDKTIEVVKEYAKKYDHIRWFSNTDAGQSDAMNKGLSLAKGSIIGFLNVDDFYEVNVLKRITKIFRNASEPTIVVGNCNVWGATGEIKYINKPKNLKLSDLVKGSNINRLPENPSAYFYHKSLHNLVGSYDTNDHFSMDIDFIFRAIQKANVCYYDEIWGNFRLIPGTKTFRGHQTGETYIREKKICLKYRACKSNISRMYYSMLFEVQNGIAMSLEYNCKKLTFFMRNPKEFITYLKNKFST